MLLKLVWLLKGVLFSVVAPERAAVAAVLVAAAVPHVLVVVAAQALVAPVVAHQAMEPAVVRELLAIVKALAVAAQEHKLVLAVMLQVLLLHPMCLEADKLRVVVAAREVQEQLDQAAVQIRKNVVQRATQKTKILRQVDVSFGLLRDVKRNQA